MITLTPYTATIIPNPSGNMDSRFPGGEAPGEWLLPAENYISEKLTGVVVSPRPDSETDLNGEIAYYRKNHSEITYRVRICVVGMAWPFKYSIVSAPAGTTIGAELDRNVDGATGKTLHTWGDDYAVVECSPANMGTGTASFEILVESQDGGSVAATWTSDRDDSEFVFIDSVSGNDASAGTFAAPLETFAIGLWESSETGTSVYAGKRAVFRTGTYTVSDTQVINTQVELDTATRPSTFMAFPGETATFDFSGYHFWSGSSMDDFSFIDMRTTGSKAAANNIRLFNMGIVCDRVLFWGNTFTNTGDSVVGSDNPCCVGFFDNATSREYIAFVDNVAESTITLQSFLTYACNHVLAENNLGQQVTTAANSNGKYHIHLKGDTANATVRANVTTGTTSTAGIAIGCSNDFAADNNEVCWNTLVTTTEGVNGAIEWSNSTKGNDPLNANTYRNSIVANARAFRYFATTLPRPVDDFGSLYSEGLASDFTGADQIATISIELQPTDFNASGELTGQARVDYLGIMGAEVSA